MVCALGIASMTRSNRAVDRADIVVAAGHARLAPAGHSDRYVPRHFRPWPPESVRNA